jgi:hypothetical protein
VLLEHQLQHEVAPLTRRARMRHRVVEARLTRDPGEQRCFGGRDVVGMVAEVDPAGLLDAVRAVPEVHGVQVRGQDPVLGLRPLEPPGQCGLAELARDRALVLVDRVLDELLRDRGAALHGATVGDVGLDRAEDPADVDAAVLVEPLVLDGDDRVLQPRRDVLGVDHDARLRPAEDREDRLPVARVHIGVLLLVLRLACRIEIRDLRRDRDHQPERERSDPEQRQDGKECEQPELADAPTFGRSGFPTEERQNAR